jgi:hypothetical protein
MKWLRKQSRQRCIAAARKIYERPHPRTRELDIVIEGTARVCKGRRAAWVQAWVYVEDGKVKQ